jgi:hypothetical protein
MSMSESKNTNINNQSRKVNMRFEHDLVEQINNTKDELIPFSAWVKAACKEKLERDAGITFKEKRTDDHVGAQVIDSTSSKQLNAKLHRDEIQAIAMELKAKGNTYHQIADHFNSLGYLTAYMKPFKRDSVTSLLRYTGNLEDKKIKL